MPHHVTQPGNRRQETFFVEDDYGAYLGLMADGYRQQRVAIWAYCLMPNHGRTGRPLGDASFLERVEKLVGRVLRPQKPGRKPRFAK